MQKIPEDIGLIWGMKDIGFGISNFIIANLVCLVSFLKQLTELFDCFLFSVFKNGFKMNSETLSILFHDLVSKIIAFCISYWFKNSALFAIILIS